VTRPSRDYKLIAVDLDGTLLDPLGVPHAADVAALRRARDAGVLVTILTGRLFSGTRDAAEAIGLRGPVGCVDGSHIVEAPTGRTLHHHAFRGDDAVKLRDAVRHSGAALFLLADDKVIHDERGKPYLDYVSIWSLTTEATEDVPSHGTWHGEAGVTAIVAVGGAGEIHDASISIQGALGTGAQIATFPTRRMENRWGLVCRASGGNKGSALRWVCEHHGITPAETVVVGDWLNDLPMFEVAGRSFAMAQAPDAVKAVATDRLDAGTLEGGGVAEALAKAFAIR
jgi:Cof subfamily protein (haloacid dehalogenase superfamily)